jgi:DNA-binding NarL/FixJ family response regulator
MTQAVMAHLFLIENEGPVRDRLCAVLSNGSSDISWNGQKGIAVVQGFLAHPQAAVLILTGYGSDEAETLAQTLGVAPRLMQRFPLHELVSAIEAMVDGMSSHHPGP